jgi:alkaline phosphatase D
VIWTRIAPDPFDPEALPPEPIPVQWVVSADERMRRPVRQGTSIARPDLAHAVHVEVRGLEPNRPYWYQFRLADAVSPLGRTRTAALIGQPLSQFRFAFASCQHYEQGFFAAYRQMVADEPDLIIHLGDYIYETTWGNAVRRHEGLEPTTLAEYRARHALYKLDPDLQRAHGAAPWLVTWDDHEVDNDYAAGESEDFADVAAFLQRRAAAYQAYYEHMPLRRMAMPRDGTMRIHQRSIFGDLIAFNLVDNRQYRSDHACDGNGVGGGQLLEDCPELADPQRSMLGDAQERWLARTTERYQARWNVLAQQTLFAPFDAKPGEGEIVWSEGWSGYPPSRARILQHWRERGIVNPVVIGGDMHSYWVTDLKADFRDEASPVLATEFVGTSISSEGPPLDRFAPLLPENPHIRYFEPRRRGYALATVTPELWRTEFRSVDSVLDPRSPTSTLAAFIIESGRPGAKPA